MWIYLTFLIKKIWYHIIFYSHQYINNVQPVEMYAIKKEIERQWTNSFVGYFTFYNKNGLHYKNIKYYIKNVSL